MLYITMILTSNECAKIKAAATRYWPDAALDTQMSRQEASRRLLQPPVDKIGPTLPVGPEWAALWARQAFSSRSRVNPSLVK